MRMTFPKSVFVLVWDDWRSGEDMFIRSSREEAEELLAEWVASGDAQEYENLRVVEYSGS